MRYHHAATFLSTFCVCVAIFGAPVSFFFLPTVRGDAGALEHLYRFIDAQATSTNPGTSPTEFSPLRALQPGTGYWCSEGNHDPDTIVSWIGVLNAKATISGLHIRWAYSPREVKVSVYIDDTNEVTVLDWHATPSDERAFDENLYFTKPSVAQTVKIQMRGVRDNYYGISMIYPIANTHPIIQIVSGITSPAGEMCLQVANGDLHVEHAQVVLDTCASGVAAGDGRDLWRINTREQIEAVASKPLKCLTLQGLDTKDGGNVVIEDCQASLESGDDRSIWDFVSYGHIVLNARQKTFCISQKGSSAGFVNLLKAKGAKASASSTADAGHRPANAVDGNLNTYWASGAFPDPGEHLVQFNIDLGTPSRLSKIRVDWEYPPFQYSVMVSSDAVTWIDVGGSLANPANTTMDGISNHVAQYLRLSLERPHPRYGKVKTKYLYGIRDIQVLSNKLQTIVQNRYAAANTTDARDKYFPVPVREFDPVLAQGFQTMEAELQSRLHSIQLAAVEVQELLPQIETCAESVKDYSQKLEGIETRVLCIQKDLMDLSAGDAALAARQLAAGLTLGDTRVLAAEDCYLIKKRNPTAPSGFYWLSPRCSSHPFRAWCDMASGAMIYIWNGNLPKKPNTSILAQITSPDSIRLHCAEMGLEPAIIRNRNHIKTIATVLKKMGFDLNANKAVPLAHDSQCLETGRCSGTFRDLMLGSDVTSILMEATTPETASAALTGLSGAGIGLGSSSVSFFDFGVTDISSIVCSTNTLLSDSLQEHVDIDCDTIAENNPLFQGLSDTNIVAVCPAGCAEDTTLEIYGGGGVYHEASSICRAAIHAGVVQRGGSINVALEGLRASFVGSINNGIQSKAWGGDDSTPAKSIRVGPVAKECPIDMVGIDRSKSGAPSVSSFLQTTVKAYKDTKNAALFVSDKSPAQAITAPSTLGPISFLQLARVSFEAPSEPKVPIEVNELLERTYKMIDETHGVDPYLITMTQEQASGTIGQGRGTLKPAETALQKEGFHAISVFQKTEDVIESLFEALGQSFSSLEEATTTLQALSARRTQLRGYASWKLRIPPAGPELESVFEPFTTFGVSGTHNWRYSPEGSVVEAATLSRETGMLGMGTYLRLKDRQFFDFSFSLEFRAPSIGPIAGISFRMRDFQNMYLVEIDPSEGGKKRLLRITKGVPQTLGQCSDGGYLPNVWHVIRVEAVHSRIQVKIAEKGKNTRVVFDVQDETFLSGSVGLFTSETSPNAPMEWKALSVEAKHCTRQGCSITHPPAPPACNMLTDSYFSRFQSFYLVEDAPTVQQNSNVTSFWSYAHGIEGRNRVIHQRTDIHGGSPGEPGTMAVMKGYYTCPHGVLKFDFNVPCAQGTIGAIFRYRTQDDYSFIEFGPSLPPRLWRKIGRNVLPVLPIISTDGSQNLLRVGTWYTAKVLFNGPIIEVQLFSEKPFSHSESSGVQSFVANVAQKLDAFTVQMLELYPIASSIPILRQAFRYPGSDVPTLSQSLWPGGFRTGLATNNCPGAVFDRFQMGPIDLMQVPVTPLGNPTFKEWYPQSNSNARPYFEVQRGSGYDGESTLRSVSSYPFMSSSTLIHDSGIDSACYKAKTFLERQAICLKISGGDGEKGGSCIKNFCSLCCDYHTSLKPNATQQRCVKRCVTQDEFAELTEEAWIGSLTHCFRKHRFLLPDATSSKHITLGQSKISNFTKLLASPLPSRASRYWSTFSSTSGALKRASSVSATPTALRDCISCCDSFPPFTNIKTLIPNYHQGSVKRTEKRFTGPQNSSPRLPELQSCHSLCHRIAAFDSRSPLKV